ncbi:hypothetical protein [Actinomadura algeriensis]|uniref:Centromere-binding protein ParB C-terminal domain-containing protein n=1 Tax=Actinomadura algeriensis TaxID=1679523 RepID=A0ABR9JQF4_9ACTN|nr:hypothetical protein [Actinomadura algeriensis]MBE1532797.1 hypothetical protein [Actinomadura algeriensis]
MNIRPSVPPGADSRADHPRWAVKPLRQLTTRELAEALEYLERTRPDDEVLGRALAGEFARRTAAEYHRTGEPVRPGASRPYL